MTDRLKGCTVVFDRDIRVDDAEHLLDAIRMLRGVIDVTPEIKVLSDFHAQIRAHIDIQRRLFKVLENTHGRYKYKLVPTDSVD